MSMKTSIDHRMHGYIIGQLDAAVTALTHAHGAFTGVTDDVQAKANRDVAEHFETCLEELRLAREKIGDIRMTP